MKHKLKNVHLFGNKMQNGFTNTIFKLENIKFDFLKLKDLRLFQNQNVFTNYNLGVFKNYVLFFVL